MLEGGGYQNTQKIYYIHEINRLKSMNRAENLRKLLVKICQLFGKKSQILFFDLFIHFFLMTKF